MLVRQTLNLNGLAEYYKLRNILDANYFGLPESKALLKRTSNKN
jgi:hypothetical protein